MISVSILKSIFSRIFLSSQSPIPLSEQPQQHEDNTDENDDAEKVSANFHI